MLLEKNKNKQETSSVGIIVGGSYKLYKHLTSTKKKKRGKNRRHTQNRPPERNDQKGAA